MIKGRNMIELSIDNKKVEIEEGTTILQAAKKIGIKIPTLCYHEGLPPYGVCGLCIVEVISNGRLEVVTACNYPVKQRIEVKTNSEKIIKERKLIVELLLAKCPNVKVVKELADQLGVEKPRFTLEDKDCILCGLCVQVCELLGIEAISLVNRGTEEDVDTPFHIASEECIGCGACAFVCPTGAIKIEDFKDKREIKRWQACNTLKRCKICGNPIAPEGQVEYVREKIDLPSKIFEICSDCKKKYLGVELATFGHI